MIISMINNLIFVTFALTNLSFQALFQKDQILCIPNIPSETPNIPSPILNTPSPQKNICHTKYTKWLFTLSVVNLCYFGQIFPEKQNMRKLVICKNHQFERPRLCVISNKFSIRVQCKKQMKIHQFERPRLFLLLGSHLDPLVSQLQQNFSWIDVEDKSGKVGHRKD